MLRFFKFLVLLPLACALVLVGVANRQAVTLFLEPWNRTGDGLSFTIPLFILLFGVLAVGIVIGSISSWVAQGKHRKAERLYRRERDNLAKECVSLKAQLPASASISKI